MNGSKDAKPLSRKLQHLGSLPQHPPPSKTGKVIWAWPEIEEALKCGWRMTDIWKALHDDGIEMPYNQFRVYVSRIRKRAANAASNDPGSTALDPENAPTPEASTVVGDPYSAIKKQRKLKQRSGFNYDPFSTDKDLLK
jgi:hypothetical protein